MLNQDHATELLNLMKNFEGKDYNFVDYYQTYLNNLNQEQLVKFLLQSCVNHKRKKIRDISIQVLLQVNTNDIFTSYILTLLQSDNAGLRNLGLRKLQIIGGDSRANTDLVKIIEFDAVTPNKASALEALSLSGDDTVLIFLETVIKSNFSDDGQGFTISEIAQWAKDEIVRRNNLIQT